MIMALSGRGAIAKELIIGFGFLNGLWIAIGLNPRDKLIEFLKLNLEGLSPALKIFFIILPIIFTLGSVFTMFKVFRSGGLFGIIAVLAAFAAGTLVLKDWRTSATFFVMAALMGLMTFKDKK
jgi:hypothetical protein